MSSSNSFPPVYNEPAQKASENLRQALPLINKHRTPVNPVNYAVWYEYVSGENQQLKKEIDLSLSRNEPITPTLIQSLYEQHVLSGMPERLEKANKGIKLVVDNTLKNINKAESTANECVAELNSTQELLNNCSDINILKSIVQDIVTKTQTLTSTSHELKQELEQSSIEMDKLKSELETIKEVARTDSLTGLLNRGAFDIELRNLCIQSDITIALVLFDLDHFKNLNDSFGHIVGDRVLQFFSSVLMDHAGSTHIAARYGGEEMALLLFNVSQQQAIDLADSVRKKLATSHLKQKDSDDSLGQITVSAGISLLQMGDTPNSLINRADLALYKSKDNGRNQVHVN
ncbi:MAG: GGDEF domain-containing protein [Piscirickettsiaceae bacterium]|nr:GGDEF domain-containing protein [Piscirickettsiaceae bacterium]